VVCQIFVLLVHYAAFDVFHDPSLGTRPEVFLIDVSNGFIMSGVTIDGPLVPYIHQFAFQSLIQWNNKMLSLGVSPEWFVWVVYMFDGVCPFPFFHQGVIMVLDYCYRVFD
jgi:hypothetical protein